MKQLKQSVTVINKSGVVVKNSKQLVNVFKEAKAAYSAKKAELKSTRDAAWNEQQAREALKHLDLDDRASRTPPQRRRSHAHVRSAPRSNAPSGASTPRRSRTQRRPSSSGNDGTYARPALMDRGYTDSFYTNDARDHTIPDLPFLVRRKPVMEQDLAGRELQRRHTDFDWAQRETQHKRRASTARRSDESFDSDLAYGELPPPLPVRRMDTEQELRGKMTLLTRMLEEAHCVQHSATATIEHLHKNPDALAAVALTLAEAANLAKKLAPGALGALAKTFPAATALLISPQFLIAAGLGLGVTVVMLGGYKIIKRLQDQKEAERDMEEPMQLQEVVPELSRVELWRRGIADAELESIGTTVDGEFVTPGAKSRLLEEGRLRPEDLRETSPKSRASSSSERRRKKEKSSEEKSKTGRSRRGDHPKSSSGRSKAASERSEGTALSRRKTVVKGVKMLFQGRTVPAEERK